MRQRPRAEQFVRPPVWYEPTPGCVASSLQPLPPERASDTLSVEYARRNSTIAQVYAARRLPGGFAGGPVYVGDGPPYRAVMWMRDTTMRDSVVARLAAMPAMEWAVTGPAPLDVRYAPYDLAAIFDWMQFLSWRPDPYRAIVAWGIEMFPSPRIRLTVNDTTFSKLVDYLDSHGVPCRMVAMDLGNVVTTVLSAR